MKENIFVLQFPKIGYKRETLEKMSDSEKYLLAKNDSNNCTILSLDEYTQILNDSIPVEKCVYTYFLDIFNIKTFGC